MTLNKTCAQCLGFIFILLLSFVASASAPVHLAGLNIQPSATASHFIFMLSGKPSWNVKYLPQQSQLIVELANTDKNFEIKNARLGSANVARIDAVEDEKHNIKFIFTTKDKISWKIYLLPKKANDNFVRLQLDIISEKPTTAPQKPSSRNSSINTPGKASTRDPGAKISSLQKTFENDIQNTFAKLAEEANKEQISHDGMVTWVPLNWDEKPVIEKKRKSIRL